jgi:guanine deaminase
MALDLRIGVFREGYQFDAIVLDGRTPNSNLRLEQNAAPEEILQKIVYHATRADIKEVWVANRRVHARLS